MELSIRNSNNISNDSIKKKKIKKTLNVIQKHIYKTFDFLNITDVPNELILKAILKYDIDKINKNTIRYIIEDVTEQINKQHKLNTILPDSVYEKKVSSKEFFVSIDSNDRDLAKWAECNEYSIDFGGSHSYSNGKQNGYIQHYFTNIISIELISSIVPKYSDTGDHLTNYPYLLLEIDEIAGIYKGSNQYTTNAFAKLRFQNDLGHFKEYTYNNGERFIQHFHPRISLNRMTIRFRCPDGSLYNFGKFMSTNSNSSIVDINASEDDSIFINNTASETINKIPCNNSLVFKITCLEPIINTHLLHKS